MKWKASLPCHCWEAINYKISRHIIVFEKISALRGNMGRLHSAWSPFMCCDALPLNYRIIWLALLTYAGEVRLSGSFLVFGKSMGKMQTDDFINRARMERQKEIQWCVKKNRGADWGGGWGWKLQHISSSNSLLRRSFKNVNHFNNQTTLHISLW